MLVINDSCDNQTLFFHLNTLSLKSVQKQVWDLKCTVVESNPSKSQLPSSRHLGVGVFEKLGGISSLICKLP